MPVVGGQRTPSVGLEGLPGVRVNPDAPAAAFGGGVAAEKVDLSGVTQEATAIFEDEKHKADQVAQTTFGSQLSGLEAKLSLAARQKTGANAFNLPAEIGDAWNTGTQDIAKSLTNDTQKIMFGRMKAMHEEALDATVQTHVAEQRKLYDAQQTDSYLTNEKNAALASGLPDRISLSIDNQKIAVAQHLQRIGAPQEQIDQATAAIGSDMHAAYLTQLVDQHQTLAAKTYFEQHKDEIVGSQLGAVEKLVKQGSVLGQAYDQFDKIRTGALDENGHIDEAKAVTQVDAIQDPEVRERTESLVRQRIGEQKNELAQQRRDLFQSATDAVDAHGKVTDVPPSVWAQLNLGERSRLTRYAKSLQDGPIQTNLTTFNDLQKMFSNPATRDAALKLDLNHYKSDLSDGDFKHFSEMQGNLQKGDEAEAKKQNGVFTNDQIIESAIRGSGLGVGLAPAAKKEDAATVNGIKQTINTQVQQLEQHAKRPATAKEVTDITNEVLTQHIVSQPNFWGFLPGVSSTSEVKKRLDQMGPNDQLVVHSRDIPRADYRAIVQQLRRQGLPLTDDAVIAAYKQSLMRLKPRGE